MRNLCPTCRQRFEDAGFCPFDGTQLVPAAIVEQATLVSGPVVAQADTSSVGLAGSSQAARAELSTVVSDQLPTQPEVVQPAALQPAPLQPAAQPGPPRDATEIEVRHRTFPLTPAPAVAPAPAVSTGEITASRTRPGPAARRRPGPSSSPPKIISRSASDSPVAALELYAERRENEYDKLVGQTLDGRYYVERKIGEGGMGVVFSARHAVIERPLAIKVLKREAMRDTATVRRFVQEAKAASRIGHPNIVDVTDFGTTPDGMTYSVMELVPGQTLGAALKRDAPFAALRALRITAQIARALAAAHDKGIVHRDLKPENVFLLDRDGRPDFVKIVDFGIAKVTPPPGSVAEPRLTRAGSVFGTPEYMAPEQAAGRSDTDGRVDIYALGVLLYEMICGRVPHRGDSMVRTLAMQMLDPIVPPSQVRPDLAITRELEAVVMGALAKKRDERFQTMGALLEALDAIMPPIVGQSVTGSPVYTLAALPPGADPGVVASLPAMPIASSEGAPGQPPIGPQAPMPTPPPQDGAPTAPRRAKDEPQFTADERPVSFQHVFTEPPEPPRGVRWPVLLLFGLIAGGAAGTIAVVATSHHATVIAASRDAAVVAIPGDAGPAPADAMATIELPAEPPIDAADLIVLPELDAGPRVHPLPPHPDAGTGIPDTPNHRGTILVQVLTKPEGANLYDGTHYRGPGGAQLEEPYGARLVITCKQPGYKPGNVEVNFDGNTTAVLCVLQRIKVCITNIKNPFDDCIDPNVDPSARAP